MKLEKNLFGQSEPEEGWVVSEPLVDTQILELVLCRFTGRKIPIDNICPDMEAGRHRDVDCRALFMQMDALAAGMVAGARFPDAQEELRAPWPVGDPIGTTHS